MKVIVVVFCTCVDKVNMDRSDKVPTGPVKQIKYPQALAPRRMRAMTVLTSFSNILHLGVTLRHELTQRHLLETILPLRISSLRALNLKGYSKQVGTIPGYQMYLSVW